MDRVVIAVALAVVAGGVAWALGRRRADPPTQAKVDVPRQLDRHDFARPDAPWLMAVFTSTTCGSCGRVTDAAQLLESDELAYAEVPWQTRRSLHDRYRITDVPLLLLADREGVVQRSILGALSFTELAAAVRDVRETAAGSASVPRSELLGDDVD